MAPRVCFGEKGKFVKAVFAILFTCLLSGLPLFADNTHEDIVSKIIQRATENEHLTEDYGLNQKTVTRWLNSDGSLKSQDIRTYKTVWIENHPYAELQTVNG